MKKFVVKKGTLYEYHGEDEDVYIPEEVDEIGSGAFINNKTIRKVVIPEGITKLNLSCFKNCISLEEVILPSSLKKIDDMAFAHCIHLKRVNLPEKIERIAKNCFYNCENLKEVHLPEGLKSIDEGAFRLCRSLEKIDIPDSVESIGRDAFSLQESSWRYENPLILNEEEGMKEIILPKTLKEIPSYAFKSQINLKKVIWPDHLEVIFAGAFSECRNLNIDSFPATLKRIEKDALLNCQISPDAVLPQDYVGDCNLYTWAKGGEVKVPIGVHTIGKGSFANHPSLKKIDLSTVSVIEEDAFFQCKNLETVLFSDKLQEVGDSAFKYCESLQSIDLPDSMKPTGIGEGVFFGCKSLQNVKLPKNLNTIKEGSFSHCTSLETISIPASVINMGKKAESQYFDGVFKGCSSLRKVNFEAEAFENPEPLILQTGIFSECTALTEINLPRNCKSLGYSCFNGCSSLENIDIPASVQIIGDQCFQNAFALKNVELPKSLAEIGFYAFKGCSNLTSIIVPAYTETINSGAFSECLNLQTVELENPAYKKVTMNDYWRSHKGLNYHLFRDCPSLKLVKYASKELQEDAFDDVNPGLTLIAPNVKFSEVQTAALKPMLCRGYAVLKEEGHPIPEEVEAEYIKYLKARRKALLPELPDFIPLLRVMVQQKLLTNDQVAELLKNEKITSTPEVTEQIAAFYNLDKITKAKQEKDKAAPKKKTLAPETLRKQLFDAVKNRDFSALEQIPAQYELPADMSATVRTFQRKTETLLDYAVEIGDLSSIQTIVKHIPINNMESGLGLAIEKQWSEAVESILTGKVNPAKAVTMYSTQLKESALEIALRNGNKAIIDLIFSKKFKLSETVLVKSFQAAIDRQDIDSANKLLEQARKIKDETYNYLLETAIQSGDRAIIDQIMDRDNTRILPHSLAMAYALRKGDLETVRKLKKKKVSPACSLDLSDFEFKTAFEKRRLNSNDYSLIRDDDYKAIFARDKINASNTPFYAINEMYEGRNDYFSHLYQRIPGMNETQIKNFLFKLAEENLCTGEDMEYFWFLAVAADFILVAKSLEDQGWIADELPIMKYRADISRKMDTFAELAVPGMSVQKGSYILEHMEKDERLNWGKSYFTGREYDLDLFVQLTQKYGNKRFRLTDKKYAMETCIKAEHLEGMKKLSEFGAINSRNIKGFIELAEKKNNIEIKMWLLAYQNEHFQAGLGGLSL